jgi:WD40 repeat protein/DNA-binding SARP family transcriptional activator
MRIDVLGPLAVDGETGAVGPRDRVVLAALVTKLGEALSAEQLADALWGDDPPASWPKVVQGCIARLRRVLGREAIETVPHGYRLAVSPSEVDAVRFERAVVRVQELLALREPDRAAYVADEALTLWRGRPLAELERWEPGRLDAIRLEELRRDAEELRLDALLQAGRYAEVLGEAQARVAEAPLRERRWALLALAQYQAGRQGDALATLRRARASLAERLGLDPGPELVALEERMLRHDPMLATAGALPEVSPVCPYLGLVPYGEEDADRFFGRGREVTACLERLGRTGVVVVVGPSGSGKSSLVRAGISATLRRDARRVTVITPGPRPMDALTTLPGAGVAPVLVVDQCEEAITLCDDSAEQLRFFAALAEHATRAPLVVALRADRLGEVAAFPSFAGLVERGFHLLTPMTAPDLRAAIEGPARQAGLLLEAGLVDLLVRDVEGEPGALPLLSHALRQTWLAREGRTLTVAGYHASGGIRGAVAQTAEEVYEAASVEQRPLLRDLLLRLVVPSAEGEPVRSRVPRRMVATDEAHDRIIELLVRARLVTSDEDAIELAHEALTRAWPRLRTWLDDDVEGQRILRHLATAADSWDAMGRPDSELYRGVRLTRAVDWRDRTRPDLTATERAFLAASEARADAEDAAARRRRRTLVGVLGGAVVVATVLGSFAVVQAGLATTERDRALAAEAAADDGAQRAETSAALAAARELAAAAVSVREEDPELSVLLALQALEVAPDDDLPLETVAALHEAVRTMRAVQVLPWDRDGEDPPGDEFDAIMSADGTLVVVSDGTARLEVRDGAGRPAWSVADGTSDGRFVHPHFSPDGALLAVAFRRADAADAGDAEDAGDAADGGVPVGIHLYEAATGRLRAVLPPPSGCPGAWLPRGRAFTPDGTALLRVVGGASGDDPDGCQDRLEVVELGSGEVTEQADLTLGDPWMPVWAGADTVGRLLITDFSAPGPMLRTRLVDRSSGETTFEREAFVGYLSPDGSVLALSEGSAASRGVALVDPATGELRHELVGHGAEIADVLFSEDGGTVYTAGVDGTARVWDAASGAQQLTLTGARAGLNRLSLANEGAWLVGAGRDATLRTWDLTAAPLGEVAAADLRPAQVASRGLAVGGDLGAVLAFEGECPYQHGFATIIDARTGERTLEVPDGVGNALALTSDGRLVAHQLAVHYGPEVTCFDQIDGALVLRDAATGEVHAELDGWCEWGDPDDCAAPPDHPYAEWPYAVSFTPDDRYLTAGGWSGAVSIWDLHEGNAVVTLGPFDGLVTGAATHPDGHVTAVYAMGGDGPGGAALHLLDRDGEELATLPFPGNPNNTGQAAFSVDGSFLALGGERLALVEAGSWTVRWEVDAHDGGVFDLAITPDGTRMATTGSDGFVRLWDTHDGQLQQLIPLTEGWAKAVRFISDHHLMVGTSEGLVAVLTTDVAELATIARDRLPRGFTAQECRTYLRLEACPDELAR